MPTQDSTNAAAAATAGTAPAARLSCYVLTKNSQLRLDEVLRSLRDIADDLLVVDSGSSDASIDIALANGARVLSRDFDNFASQRSFALSQCAHEWVLEIDSDEVASPALQQRIAALKAGGFWYDGRLPDAFGIRRQWFVVGQRVHCFYPSRCPDQPLRLYQKSRVNYLSSRIIHEAPSGHEITQPLEEPLYHYTCDSIDQMYEKVNRYTTLSAQEMWQRNLRGNWLKTVFMPWLLWAKFYLAYGGWKDGAIGLIHGKYVRDTVWQKYVKLRYDFARKPR